jgi:GT2 family glycosyltransferase
VIVDNASTDGTAAAAREAGVDVIELGTNGGYSAAINHGIKHFRDARSLLILNPDVELTAGSVGTMADVLEDERVGIVAPKTLIPGDPPRLEPNQRRDPTLLSTWATAILGAHIARRWASSFEAVSDPRSYEVTRDVDWAVGAVLLCSRCCVESVGMWDESFFLYSEEVDYCRRARDAGLVVRYTPNALVYHRGGDGLVNPRLRAMMSVNRVREYARRHSRPAAWCFLAGTLVHEVTRALAGQRAAWTAAVALVSPRRRPAEIHARQSLIPH